MIAELPAATLLVAGGAFAPTIPELTARAHVFAALDEFPDWLALQRQRLAARLAGTSPDQRR